MYTRDRDEGKKYQNTFSCRSELVKYEEFSQCLCFTARSCGQFTHNENSPLFNMRNISTVMITA